ncbi:MAG: cyclase family protein [bacterium]
MIYDITMPLFPGQLVWPGDPEIEIAPLLSISSGDPANISLLKFGTHTGTHIDAPRHMLADGPGVDQIEPEKLIGPVQVLDITSSEENLILPEAIRRAGFCRTIPRVLFKTGNSQIADDQKFHRTFVSLARESAEWLVQEGVFLIGIDYLSIEAADTSDYGLHRILLSRQVVLVEGLILNSVPAGIYELICAPLKIVQGDGAPARVFLKTLSKRSSIIPSASG